MAKADERTWISNDSVYQVISQIRKQIEPNHKKPQYLLTVRGRPEGGYLLYPTGKVN